MDSDSDNVILLEATIGLCPGNYADGARYVLEFCERLSPPSVVQMLNANVSIIF